MLPALGRRIGGGSRVWFQESLPGSTSSGIDAALGLAVLVVSPGETASTAAACPAWRDCTGSKSAGLVGIVAAADAMGREARAEARNR
jgi:hypothetical protein